MNSLQNDAVKNAVESLRNDIVEIADFIFANPEISSEEHQSCKYLANKLRENGMEVEENYLDMNTSFVSKIGSGKPKLCLFAEYDALPMGHACGHNIIAAWAIGTFLSISRLPDFKGTLYLFGSPAEEGRGSFASSKVRISGELKKIGIEAAFAIHPGDRWEVFGGLYARWRESFTFIGRESHAAGSPEDGINALDAAVSFYQSVRSLRSTLAPDKTAIISSIIREGGVAVNIVPGISEVWVDVRTRDNSQVLAVGDRIEAIARGISTAYNCELKIKSLAPVTCSFIRNEMLDSLMLNSAEKYIQGLKVTREDERRPMGSSDIGNVSSIVPTTQLIVKVAEAGTPLHSKEFLQSAGSNEAKKSLLEAVMTVTDAILHYGQSEVG